MKNNKIYFGLLLILMGAGILFWTTSNSSDAKAIAETSDDEILEITMYRGERCNCCIKWADYLEDQGFEVIDAPVDNLMEIKIKRGVPSNLGSCHTAVIDGYVVEGHVPAKEIRRMVSEQPDAIGIAVPGMPAGSPGMESFRSETYRVILFDKNRNLSVYAQY